MTEKFKNIKRIVGLVSFIMTLVMTMCFSLHKVYAEDVNVCSIGSVEYASLEKFRHAGARERRGFSHVTFYCHPRCHPAGRGGFFLWVTNPGEKMNDRLVFSSSITVDYI